jgi:hypothetical protein
MRSHPSFTALRRLRSGFAVLAICVMAGCFLGPAAAGERFVGQWSITGAVRAPWAPRPGDASDEQEAKRLIGKRVEISAGALRAPAPLGCARPSYAFHDTTPDMLFEGGLNADGDGKPTDPVVVARALRLENKTLRAMTASCSEVEFVLLDPDTLLFGLNNRVFTMKRAQR